VKACEKIADAIDDYTEMFCRRCFTYNCRYCPLHSLPVTPYSALLYSFCLLRFHSTLLYSLPVTPYPSHLLYSIPPPSLLACHPLLYSSPFPLPHSSLSLPLSLSLRMHGLQQPMPRKRVDPPPPFQCPVAGIVLPFDWYPLPSTATPFPSHPFFLIIPIISFL
jgi:hypothetical protein